MQPSYEEPLTVAYRSRASLLETIVAVAQSSRPEYGALARPVPAPELPSGEARTVAQGTLRELFRNWGLDPEHLGSFDWNPLGEFIAAGSRVVLKPNWVFHANKSGQGTDCLLTHTSVIEAVLEYVALAHPGSVIVGDAPVQGCDFETLRRVCNLDEMEKRLRITGMNLSIVDFRRTLLRGEHLGDARIENRRAMGNYVLFDLKQNSLLEPLAADADKFRVTLYNPDLMGRTHAAGKHQYLVAREIIEADVVISLPKLKCHKKACITGALKNLVGINGNKEYLPHHRKGGGAGGGDCYAGKSWLKRQAEGLLDAANRRHSRRIQYLLAQSAGLLARSARILGADDNLEGSWHGNDTVWRTCLDLQRILRYGREDGTLQKKPQRVVISITDAIVAGEGEGPMAPTPVPAGFLTGAFNPAAAEWVHARLMGFDPRKISLVRHAFGDFPHPLTTFEPHAVRVRMAGKEQQVDEIYPFFGRPFLPSKGWKGHCELDFEG